MSNSIKKIAIIGSGGAGKSTLAVQLGEKLGLDVYHIDALFWKPGWVATPREELREILADIVKRDSWIIDGNYNDSMDIRLAAADTVVFLDFPPHICLWRVVKRFLQNRGRTRPDMGAGCPEQIDCEFIGWIWRFPINSKPRILQKIEEYFQGEQVITLRSPREVEEFLQTVP